VIEARFSPISHGFALLQTPINGAVMVWYHIDLHESIPIHIISY
jgi:hypothetical protein